MTRNAARRLHGASIEAPFEGYVSGESPLPPGVGSEAEAAGAKEPSAVRGWLSALRVLGGLVVVVGAAIAVAWSAHRYALTSPRFAVRQIQVHGGKRLGPEQVQREGGVQVGANLFALDTAAVERRLLENPWLSSAKVTRKLPATLDVTVTEREAQAITVLDGKPYLVSREAEPFKAVAASDPVDLPIITGLDATQLSRERASELSRLKAGLDVLRQYERLGISRSLLPQEVHLGANGSVMLSVGKQGIVVNLAMKQLRQRLLMAERVVLEMRRSNRVPGIVFADNQAHPERVVVRMR